MEGVPEVDPAARGLSLMLDLVGADLDRARVMEFLTSARIRWASVLGPEAEVSPARWDRLSAQAGIVNGLEAWRKRLGQAKANREAREYEDDRDLRLYDSLARLIERLATRPRDDPGGGLVGRIRSTPRSLSSTRWIEQARPHARAPRARARGRWPSTPRPRVARSSWRGCASFWRRSGTGKASSATAASS